MERKLGRPMACGNVDTEVSPGQLNYDSTKHDGSGSSSEAVSGGNSSDGDPLSVDEGDDDSDADEEDGRDSDEASEHQPTAKIWTGREPKCSSWHRIPDSLTAETERAPVDGDAHNRVDEGVQGDRLTPKLTNCVYPGKKARTIYHGYHVTSAEDDKQETSRTTRQERDRGYHSSQSLTKEALPGPVSDSLSVDGEYASQNNLNRAASCSRALTHAPVLSQREVQGRSSHSRETSPTSDDDRIRHSRRCHRMGSSIPNPPSPHDAQTCAKGEPAEVLVEMTNDAKCINAQSKLSPLSEDDIDSTSSDADCFVTKHGAEATFREFVIAGTSDTGKAKIGERSSRGDRQRVGRRDDGNPFCDEAPSPQPFSASIAAQHTGLNTGSTRTGCRASTGHSLSAPASAQAQCVSSLTPSTRQNEEICMTPGELDMKFLPDSTNTSASSASERWHALPQEEASSGVKMEASSLADDSVSSRSGDPATTLTTDRLLREEAGKRVRRTAGPQKGDTSNGIRGAEMATCSINHIVTRSTHSMEARSVHLPETPSPDQSVSCAVKHLGKAPQEADQGRQQVRSIPECRDIISSTGHNGVEMPKERNTDVIPRAAERRSTMSAYTEVFPRFSAALTAYHNGRALTREADCKSLSLTSSMMLRSGGGGDNDGRRGSGVGLTKTEEEARLHWQWKLYAIYVRVVKARGGRFGHDRMKFLPHPMR